MMVRSEGDLNTSGPAVNDAGGVRLVQALVGLSTSQTWTANLSPSGSIETTVTLFRI